MLPGNDLSSSSCLLFSNLHFLVLRARALRGQAERQAYTVVSLLLFAFAVVMQNMPQFPTAAWNYHRIAVYGMILGFGV